MVAITNTTNSASAEIVNSTLPTIETPTDLAKAGATNGIDEPNLDALRKALGEGAGETPPGSTGRTNVVADGLVKDAQRPRTAATRPFPFTSDAPSNPDFRKVTAKLPEDVKGKGEKVDFFERVRRFFPPKDEQKILAKDPDPENNQDVGIPGTTADEKRALNKAYREVIDAAAVHERVKGTRSEAGAERAAQKAVKRFSSLYEIQMRGVEGKRAKEGAPAVATPAPAAATNNLPVVAPVATNSPTVPTNRPIPLTVTDTNIPPQPAAAPPPAVHSPTNAAPSATAPAASKELASDISNQLQALRDEIGKLHEELKATKLELDKARQELASIGEGKAPEAETAKADKHGAAAASSIPPCPDSANSANTSPAPAAALTRDQVEVQSTTVVKPKAIEITGKLAVASPGIRESFVTRFEERASEMYLRGLEAVELADHGIKGAFVSRDKAHKIIAKKYGYNPDDVAYAADIIRGKYHMQSETDHDKMVRLAYKHSRSWLVGPEKAARMAAEEVARDKRAGLIAEGKYDEAAAVINPREAFSIREQKKMLEPVVQEVQALLRAIGHADRKPHKDGSFFSRNQETGKRSVGVGSRAGLRFTWNASDKNFNPEDN
jgi:hypothetical protein